MVKELPIGHSDQRSEHNSTSVCKHHRLEGADGVSDAESSDRGHCKNDLHQNIGQLLPLPIHLETRTIREDVRNIIGSRNVRNKDILINWANKTSNYIFKNVAYKH